MTHHTLVVDPMVEAAADRRTVKLRDGTTATLIAWRPNGTMMKVLTAEYRHRTIPKTYLMEVCQ